MEDKEKKTVKNKGKKIFLKSIILLIVLCIIGLGIYVFFTKINQSKIPNLVVSSTNHIDGQTALDSGFKILSDEKTTQEYISKNVSIEPNIEYEIKELSDVEYEIIPKDMLNSNSIYNVVYNNEQSKYKWSFQTEKVYNVTSLYPINEAMNVDPRSIIEVTFSYIPNEDIDKYFSISPYIEGKFEYDERTVRFIPNTQLDTSAKYEVTIKKGFGNKENEDVLKADATTIFYTTYANYNEYPLNISNIFTFKTGSNIELPFNYPSYTRDITDIKLQIYKYNNENEFVTGVTKQQQTISYNSLVEISTRGLNKVLDVKYTSTDITEGVGGYDKIINVDTILDVGYYLVTIQENGRTYYVNLQINDMIGYVSYYDNEALIWVNSANTNDKVSDAIIYRNGEYIGDTNKDGVLRVYDFQRKEGNYNSEYIKVEKDNQLPLYMFFMDWYNSDSQNITNDQNLNIYSFIDRAKYKQNEELKLWGFVKHRENIKYENVSIELCYSDYSTILETKQIPVDEFGAFTTTFDLTGYDNGFYYIKIYANGKVLDYQYFEIRQYDTKNYNIEAKLNKDVVFAGEELQLDLTVTLFDGTPIQDTEFKYSYFYGENKKTGSIKTNSNGVATAILNTEYSTQYSAPVYANLQIYNDGLEAEIETQYIQFVLLPKKESYTLDCTYNKANDKYIFNLSTYMYDKNNKEYIGQTTNRDVTIKIDKYEKVQVLDYVKYNEDTKLNEEVYKIEKRFIGTEYLNLSTQNGKETLEYKNPIPAEVDGYINYTSTMQTSDRSIVTNTNYTYIEGLQDYTSGTEYTTNYDYNKTYKVGDIVNIKVLKNMQSINEDVNIMHIIKSVKGVEVVVTKNPQYSFTFSSEYGTDIIVKTYVFDGIGIYKANISNEYMTYSLDKSELQLDIDINFDKASYKPGEEATITVTTKYKGSPVEANVNICAVDQSYLAYYSKQTDIVNSLYNYYYFNNSNDFISHQIWGLFAGGGEGGGGDERQQFATTAFFHQVITDANGKATIKIQWPDNVTSWGVLAQGISNQYTAGQSMKNVSVTLPFFVTPIYEETYLVNEEPNINIRANGVNVKNGDEVVYTVTLTLPDGSQKEQNISSIIGQYASYQLPNLLPGNYTIKIYGKCNDYSDTVIHEFNVEESMFSTVQLQDYKLKKNEKINTYATVARMYLYNTSTEKIIQPLLELTNLPNIRNDQIVISKLANQMLKKLTDNEYVDNCDAKFFDTEGIELMDNSQKDLLLTTKILSTGYSYMYKDGMINFLQEYINNSDVDIREKLIAFWGLASLKQPVLLQLHELKNEIPKANIYERVILGLAYADIGDFDNANAILNEILPQITSSNKEIYEYVTILTIKLNNEYSQYMYEQYLTLDRESQYTNFVKLFYVQNQILKNVNKANLTLSINGKNKVYDLKEIGITILDIKQNDNVVVTKLDKNVGAKIEQYRTIDKTNSNNILTKEYIVNGTKSNNFNVGDIVKTRIYIDYTKLNSDIQYFQIEDILPNCMVYLQEVEYIEYDKNIVTLPTDINGNKISFVISLYDDSKPYIEYEARVVSTGKYLSDGTILKTYDNVIHDYVSAGSIEVNE